MTLCVFDIAVDGTATIPKDTELTGQARYRWWHFDLADPNLATWTTTHLPDIPAAALMQPETRPRCDRFDDGLILNLRGINLNKGQQAEQMVSVRVWMTDNLIVTARVRKVFAVETIRGQIEANAAPETPAAFLRSLIGDLTERAQNEVLAITTLTEFFEESLEDENAPLPKDLSLTRRRVIRLRRYLEPQRAALVKLANSDILLIPEDERMELRELANRTTLVVEELDAQRERLHTVQDEHDLSVSRRQARHGHILSVVAAVFLPMGFITGLFGVNVGGMPGVDNAWGFALLCIGTVVLTLLLIGLMRLLKWF